ncbi:DEAD/DEAH box helicase [Clostridium botulinum]|uniref:DEAD/DEAH box helicase n=1 Tax=Clostridium botulinum TaxID=1491 RepID=UPI0013F884D8|nr:DEAD/DEAH box helicase [Clostridium botulinum]MCD3217435.1 DEAD/DEAH box helicase [Clostridium botulinum C]NFV47575.1 DEAD/DEAH box helicase [Clostridium botulinum]
MNFLTDLYKHQIKAVEKLSRIKVSALYMEMGTGKTRTALELIDKRIKKGRVNHVLWLCPCSVKENLRKDIIKHTGEEHKDLITICGIETLSSSIKSNRQMLDLVQNKQCYLIVDESNLVKNFRAKRTKNIIRLAEHCKYKLILNGTPISRNEEDLFSQWYILDWRILGYQSFWSFAANHLEYDPNIPGRVVECLNTDYLVKKIAPYSYQVKKSECLDLPPKTYDTYYFYLSDEQEEEYERVKDLFLACVDEFEPNTLYRLFTALQLVLSGKKIVSNIRESIKSKNIFNSTEDNPRIEILQTIISEISEKVIIFCKYTQEIKDIVDLLNNQYGEGTAIPFHGELSLKKRQENLNKFCTTSRFLIANKTCAGYGLNLQFCNYIIYYSNDWDYSTRSQSEDRVHRIGQNKNVHIIDICASNKLDERILKCLWRKENLVDSFKKELEHQKHKKDLELWISGKTYNGKKYRKPFKMENCNNLKEETS